MADIPDPPGAVPVPPVPHFQTSQELASPIGKPGVNWTRKTCALCKLFVEDLFLYFFCGSFFTHCSLSFLNWNNAN
jgi:hypothetical protein